MSQVNKRIEKIRDKYKFEYAKTIELSTSGGIHSTCFLEGGLYLGRFEREGYEVKGRIEVLDPDTSENLYMVLDGLVLKPGKAACGSPLVLCGIPGEKKLVFPAYEPDGNVIIRTFDLLNGQMSNFERVPDPGHLSIVDIKLVNDHIYALDMFSHTLKKYSLSGELIFNITMPEGYAFPFSFDLMGDESLLIVCYQGMMTEKFPKFAREGSLGNGYFLQLYPSKNEFQPMDSELTIDDFGNMIGHPGDNCFFIIKGDAFIKLDYSLRVIYRTAFTKFLKDHLDIYDIDGKVNFILSHFENDVLIYNVYGRPQKLFQLNV